MQRPIAIVVFRRNVLRKLTENNLCYIVLGPCGPFLNLAAGILRDFIPALLSYFLLIRTTKSSLLFIQKLKNVHLKTIQKLFFFLRESSN